MNVAGRGVRVSDNILRARVASDSWPFTEPWLDRLLEELFRVPLSTFMRIHFRFKPFHGYFMNISSAENQTAYMLGRGDKAKMATKDMLGVGPPRCSFHQATRSQVTQLV